ncbi:hypothetical protein CARUB_v10011096mg [Capsella rubella]|uniref:Uncharacterized protein n=1 Tax=Capsella rubella TaxID=81985 RepID=R0GL37_9BRAS|nr:hypothetical protein CARUB_v10011096mg [Capsella rubella]
MPTEDEHDDYTITAEEYDRHMSDYWRVVAESEGFDCDEYESPVVLTAALLPFDCQDGSRYPYPLLVKRYALLGLHRYNILEKFNRTMSRMASYYLTFLALDPTISSQETTFQVRVDEQAYTSLDLTVSVARPKKDKNTAASATTNKVFIPHFHASALSDDSVFQGELPDWPTEDALNDDRNGFYVLKESEWRITDWISLYLELLICSNDKGLFGIVQSGLSQVQILKVAIQTEEEDQKPPSGRLNARRAHVYITFQGLAKSPSLVEIGEHVERKAIIRRVIDACSGFLTLTGKFWSGKDTEQSSTSMTLQSGEKD